MDFESCRSFKSSMRNDGGRLSSVLLYYCCITAVSNHVSSHCSQKIILPSGDSTRQPVYHEPCPTQGPCYNKCFSFLNLFFFEYAE